MYNNSNGLDIWQRDFAASIGFFQNGKSNYRDEANIRMQQALDRMNNFQIAIQRQDCLQAISRFDWMDLPEGISNELIERTCYFRGQCILYWDNLLEQWFLLPFTLCSEEQMSISVYGDYRLVRPVPFNGFSEAQTPFTDMHHPLWNIKRKPVYSVEEAQMLVDTHGEDYVKENYCVILRDYSRMLNFDNIPMHNIQAVFIQSMVEILPMLRTLMFRAAMPKLVKVDSEASKDVIEQEWHNLETSVLLGKPYVPVTTFQDLETVGDDTKGIEDFFRAYESFDNMRKRNLGIISDGTYQKAAQMSVDEQSKNGEATLVLLDNSYDQRKMFVEIANTLFGLDMKISCKIIDKMDQMQYNNSMGVKDNDTKAVSDSDTSGSISES